MENIAVKKYLVDAYNNMAGTHSYIFGYVMAHMVYAAVVNEGAELLPYISSVDKASEKNGGTYQLKYKPNKAQLATLIASADEIRPICSEEYLENLYIESKAQPKHRHNRGQLFEGLVQNAFGGKLSDKANAKFTDCGDININGVEYQIKYLKATFTDERTINNLNKAA